MQKMTPVTYHPTHSRTLPPPDQGNEENFLLLTSVVMFCCIYLIDNLFQKMCLFPLDYSLNCFLREDPTGRIEPITEIKIWLILEG